MKAFSSFLKIISCVFLLSSSIPAMADPGPKDSKNPPAFHSSTTSIASGSESSNTACYFNDNGNISWHWGLAPNNSWYSFPGSWITTPYTKIQKFKTSTSYNEIYQSCEQSQKYYKFNGNLFAIFAATSGTGNNYPILLGGAELYPEK